MSKKLPELLIDFREDSLLIEAFKELHDNVTVKELECGDYVCGNCIIEHKTAIDFINSVYDGRVFQQAQDLILNENTFPYILISARLRDFEFYGHSIPNILETISSLNVRGVNTHLIETTEYFVKYSMSLFRKHNDGKNRTVNPVRKGITNADLILNNYCSIPEIGKDLAIRLKERFPTPFYLYNGTVEQFIEVDGIGIKKASRICNFIHGVDIIEQEKNR